MNKLKALRMDVRASQIHTGEKVYINLVIIK